MAIAESDRNCVACASELEVGQKFIHNATRALTDRPVFTVVEIDWTGQMVKYSRDGDFRKFTKRKGFIDFCRNYRRVE